MSAFSTYLANELLDHCLRNSAYTPPATVYVALFTADAGLESNNQANEVSGGAYARQSMAFDVAATSVTQNTSDVVFPTATADWGTITYAALVDDPTSGAGNVLIWGQLAASKTVNNGDTFKFLTGDFDVFFD